MTVSARPSGRYRSARTSARYRSTRRRPPRPTRSSRRTVALVLLALAVLVTLVLGAFGTSSPSDGSAVPASAARLAPASRPLPQVIALEGSLRLQMPVSQRQVTALGYHGAGTDALPLQPVGSQANEGLFARLFHGLFGGGGGGLRYYQLGGGQGPSTGALDVGAAAGTDVFAPVDGTVVSMQPFVLDAKQYGRLIQIQPSGTPSVVVSLSQLRADPALTVGSPVAAGTTKVGVVLDLSHVERQALASYTHDDGNHVTLEVEPAVTSGLR
jgi:murein DD-endopeptidase MepM/ murein hydrolase activator NlpD